MPIKTKWAWLAVVFTCIGWPKHSDAQNPIAIIQDAQLLSSSSVCPGFGFQFESASMDVEVDASFTWNFGITAQPPTAEGPGPHAVVFPSEGIQLISLVVDNNNGSATSTATVEFTVLEAPAASMDLISLGWNYDAYEEDGESFFVHCNSMDTANFAFELMGASNLVHSIDWGDGSAMWTGIGSALIAEHDYALGAYVLTHEFTDPLTGCESVEEHSVFNGTAPNISFQSSGTYSCLGDVFEVSLGSQGGLTDYQLLFSDSTSYAFTTASDTTIQHSFESNSCGFETNSYSNAYMLEIVATNGCSFDISTDIEFDPVFVSSAPNAALESTACPGCSGASFQLADVSTDAVFASPSGCSDTLNRYWVISSSLDYTLDAGQLGDANGYTGDDYAFGGWVDGSQTIAITVNEPGIFEAWLYTGNVCGYDSVSYVCEILPAGDIEVQSSVFDNGTLEICDGDSVGPFDLVSSLPDDTIYWTVYVPAAVGGVTVFSGSGVSPLTLPGWVLTNNSISTQTVEVEVGLGCDTGAEVLTIDVLPTIQVYLGPPTPPDTVCSGESLFMLVNTTVHDVYVEWEIDSLSVVEGGTSGSGPVITDQLSNPTDIVQALNYTFTTPFANCPAEPFVYPVYVVPEYALPSPLDSVVACPGEQVDAPEYDVAMQDVVYSWYVDGDEVGVPATGAGYLDAFEAQNNSSQEAHATVVVQADLHGCLDETQFEVLVHPQPVLTGVGPEAVVCHAQPSDLTISSSVLPVDIQWSVDSQGAVIGAMDGTGGAPVFIADALENGSSVLDSATWVFTTPSFVCPAEPLTVTVFVAPELDLMPMDSVHVCNGEAVVLENAELNVAGVNYSWVSEAGNSVGLDVTGDSLLLGWDAYQATDSVVAEAEVFIVAEIHGCTDSTAFQVAVEPIPTVEVANWVTEVCSNQALEVEVGSSVTSGQVVWEFTAGDSIVGANAGAGATVQDTLVNSGSSPDSATYEFWVAGAFCPSDTFAFSVTVLPSFEMTPLGPLEWCNGDEAVVDGYGSGAEGVNYSWTNSNSGIGLGLSGEGLVPAWAIVNETDEAVQSTLTVFANLGGCPEESVTVELIAHPTPQLTANVGPNGGLDCQTGTGVIEAFSSTGAGDFEFDGTYVIGSTGSVAEVGAAGEYQVDFTDAATGCTSQIDVTVNEAVQVLIADYVLDSLACFGQDNATITIDAGGGEDLLYNWTPPVSTTESAADLGPGTYAVVVTNASNCQDSAIFTLEPVLPIEVALVESGASICGASNGFIEVEATGGYGNLEFIWPEASGALLWGVPAGVYPVIVSDEYGCEVEASFSIDCAEDIPIDVHQLITPNGDGKNDVWVLDGLYLYPNHTVKVFNRWGTLVYEAAPYQNDWGGTWDAGSGDGSPLPSATYYYLFDPGLDAATPSRGFIEIQNEGR